MPTIGTLLREWRHRRGLSQLALSERSGVSTRYLSTVETGRSTPSRQLVLHLADQLSVPLRERNALLVAAGYAPVYRHRALDDADMTAARTAVRRILDAHLPYPAVVVDRHWTLVDSNAAARVFLDGAAADLLVPPVNMLRLGLHPDGLAPRIANVDQVRAGLLGRLRRQIAATGDPVLSALHDELAPDAPTGPPPVPAPHDITMPIRIRYGTTELALFGTLTMFGTPQDVTLDELVVELYYPADDHTAAALRALP